MHQKKKAPSIVRSTANIQVKTIDEANRTITAIASSETRDRYGDVVKQDGIQVKNFMKNPVIPFAHKYKELPVAKALKVWKGKEGGKKVTYFKAQFADFEFAETVFKLLKEGFLNAFSIGFAPRSWEDAKEDGIGWTRYFTKTELLEISVVPVPANPDALALAVSKGVISEDEEKEFFSVYHKDLMEDEEDECSMPLDPDGSVSEEEKECRRKKRAKEKETSECGISTETKAELYEQHKAATKAYRKGFEKIRVLLGIMPEDDEQKTIEKTLDVLMDVIGEERSLDDEDEENNTETPPTDEEGEDSKGVANPPKKKARPASTAELTNLVARALEGVATK